jgi:uncharacterized protein (DUF169 family)
MQRVLEVLTRTVNPPTAPVGATFVKDAAAVEKAKVKLRGKRITVCQQVAYSRYYGWSTWATAQDAHCVLGACAVGLVPTPARVAEGVVNTGVYQQDQPAAARMQASLPRVSDRYAGLLTFPAARPVEGFAPDVVVVYLNTAQAMRIVQAILFRDGGELAMRTSGDAGVCSRGIAQPFLTGEPAIEIPCLGDRRFAMAQDFELLCGIPASWLGRIADGLEATHKAGIRYPIPFQIPESCELPATFTTGEADRDGAP